MGIQRRNLSDSIRVWCQMQINLGAEWLIQQPGLPVSDFGSYVFGSGHMLASAPWPLSLQPYYRFVL